MNEKRREGLQKWNELENTYRDYGISSAKTQLIKDSIRLIPAFLILIFGMREALDLSIASMLCGFIMGSILMPFILIKGMNERKEARSRFLDKALFSMTYRYGLLIQSGHSLRKALLLAMESETLTWRSFPVWREAHSRLKAGGDYEAALIKLQAFKHSGTKSWARCCLYGERKSEADLVKLLHEWMEDFKMDAQQKEATTQSSGQLWLMLPAMFQFGVLMILLISPIFLGGLET